MRRVVFFLFLPLILLLGFAAVLSAQAAEQPEADTSPRAVEDRYIAESDSWRLSLMEYIFKGDAGKYAETEGAMRQFTPAVVSYVAYKRPGERLAQSLYYRNLENIAKITQLKQTMEEMQRTYPEYTKDFFAKYTVTIEEFGSFENFSPAYDRLMSRWRGEFEAAMQKKDANALALLREDMQILRQGVTVFVLLPGKSASKVPQLQTMAGNLKHSILMLRMYERTTQEESSSAANPG
ncbi:MAG: hypothetical protein LBC99_02195 [Spirochaetota bacterium]|nr:hypothetical protein [Spirochaetota bacterium]